MSDEFPELPKHNSTCPTCSARRKPLAEIRPSDMLRGCDPYDHAIEHAPETEQRAPAGPFVLVNVEKLEREIDDYYSRAIEAMAEARSKARSQHGNYAELLTGKIDGHTEMRAKAIEAIRRAAGGVR